ncbi:MAG: DUF5069 domain-containing protein [Nitrospiria bacterium]
MSLKIIDKLRSPREILGGYVFLPRLIDKVRLHAKGELPREYVANLLGKANTLDQRFIQFTGLDGEKLREAILKSKTDIEVLAWVEKNSQYHTAEEKESWISQIHAYRPTPEGVDVRKKIYPELASQVEIGSLNVFDMIDMDEGRIPVNSRQK